MASFSRARSFITTWLPDIPFRAQSPAEWAGPFPLPRVVADYYRYIGPVDAFLPGYGSAFYLPRLAALWEFQAGYRYHAITGEVLSDWDDDWLVIGDQGGDPFIFSRSTGRILYALHGAGVWQPALMFDDLEQMLLCLGALSAVYTAIGADFLDADAFIREEHRAEAQRRLVGCGLTPEEAHKLLHDLGWATASDF